jgi:hypothetical protein
MQKLQISRLFHESLYLLHRHPQNKWIFMVHCGWQVHVTDIRAKEEQRHGFGKAMHNKACVPCGPDNYEALQDTRGNKSLEKNCLELCHEQAQNTGSIEEPTSK